MARRLPIPGLMPALLAGAAIAGGAVARYGSAAAARRESLARGDLRELDAMWTWVDDACWHARFSTPPDQRAAPSVVLVHGFGVSSRYFVPFAEHLAALGDVFAPDLPGHGRTDSPDVPLGIAGFAEALAGWLDTMRLTGVRMIGHSMGCQIAVELAVRRPDLVDRLVLIGPTIDRDARSLPATLPRFIAGGFREPPGIGLVLLKDYVRARRALPREIRSMFNYALEDAVPRLGAIPLLLVRGEHDLISPAPWLRLLERRARNARIAVVPGAAHAAQFSDPEALLRVVRPFLEDTAPTAERQASAATRPASSPPL